MTIKDALRHATRRTLSNIVQFRTGHGLLGKHFRTNGAHQVTCNCGDEQEKTVEHMLVSCPNLEGPRELLRQVSPALDLSKLLNSKEGLQATVAFLAAMG